MGSIYLLTCDALDYEEEIHDVCGMSGACYTSLLCRTSQPVVAVPPSPPLEDWVARRTAGAVILL